MQAFIRQAAVRCVVLWEMQQRPPHKHPAARTHPHSNHVTLGTALSKTASSEKIPIDLYLAGYSPNDLSRATSLFLFRPAGSSFCWQIQGPVSSHPLVTGRGIPCVLKDAHCGNTVDWCVLFPPLCLQLQSQQGVEVSSPVFSSLSSWLVSEGPLT